MSPTINLISKTHSYVREGVHIYSTLGVLNNYSMKKGCRVLNNYPMKNGCSKSCIVCVCVRERERGMRNTKVVNKKFL